MTNNMFSTEVNIVFTRTKFFGNSDLDHDLNHVYHPPVGEYINGLYQFIM